MFSFYPAPCTWRGLHGQPLADAPPPPPLHPRHRAPLQPWAGGLAALNQGKWFLIFGREKVEKGKEKEIPIRWEIKEKKNKCFPFFGKKKDKIKMISHR